MHNEIFLKSSFLSNQNAFKAFVLEKTQTSMQDEADTQMKNRRATQSMGRVIEMNSDSDRNEKSLMLLPFLAQKRSNDQLKKCCYSSRSSKKKSNLPKKGERKN